MEKLPGTRALREHTRTKELVKRTQPKVHAERKLR